MQLGRNILLGIPSGQKGRLWQPGVQGKVLSEGQCQLGGQKQFWLQDVCQLPLQEQLHKSTKLPIL